MAAPVLAKAWVGLVPTLQGSEKKIAQELDGVDTTAAGEKAGKKYGAALGAGILIAGALITKGLSDAVTNASDLSESINAVNVSYGDAANGVLALSKNSATALGLSSSDFNSLAVQFSAFSKTIAGDGGDVVGTLEGITGRAADFASVMNLDVADAAAIFQSGLAGETEPLRKYGIDLSAAAVQAYALANGIGDGTGALTEAEKVQARYGLLMQQTSQTQGDFANTSDGFANSQRVLGANLENLSATIGNALVPALAGATSFLIPIVTFLGENTGVLIAIAAVIGVTLVAAFIAWTASIWASTIALLANPVTWIILAIVALIAAVVLLVMNWDAVVKWITDVWAGFISWITDVINGFVSWWNSIWAAVGSFIGDVWNNIVNWVEDAISNVKSVIFSVVLGIWNWWQGIWNSVSSFFTGIWNGIVAVVEGVGNAFRSVFEGIRNAISNAFNGIVSIVRGPINGIIALANSAINALNGLSVTIPDWVPFVGGQTWGLSLPNIPYLAAGATVMPTPGGTLAVLAEAGRPESVVDTGLMNRALEEGLAGTGRADRGPQDLSDATIDKLTSKFARAVVQASRVDARMGVI